MIPGDYKKLSDEELVHRYVHRHEQAAFAALFERYSHLVLGVCLKYLKEPEAAKDATQQIFIKLLEDLKRFEIEHFKAWLYKVAKNYCYMQLRRNTPQIQELSDHADMEFEEDWHHKIEEEHLLERLEDAIKTLNAEQRTCIEQFYLQKKTYAEIAERTQYSILQVKSYIQNGRRNLKIKLTGGSEVKI